MKRSTATQPTAPAKCQCPYHLLADGITADVFEMPADNTAHGREVMRLLLLRHAEATLSQDWLTLSGIAQWLAFLSTLLVREATRNLMAEVAPEPSLPPEAGVSVPKKRQPKRKAAILPFAASRPTLT